MFSRTAVFNMDMERFLPNGRDLTLIVECLLKPSALKPMFGAPR
jgi:hypothetical protein